jgi:ribosomal protein S3
MASQISKKRKFVADGVFRAELNEFFTRELAEEGYSGCDVRVTHARTEVVTAFCFGPPYIVSLTSSTC